MSVVSGLIRDMELWTPQSEGLEVFASAMRAFDPAKDLPKSRAIGDLQQLHVIQQQIKAGHFDVNAILTADPAEFVSLCFAIATGGGKTRLMGACIAYLYYTRKFRNFFILSKGETIYNKHRMEDFHPSSPKYVFRGLPEFPVPRLIDGDSYARYSYPDLFYDGITLYLFNIEKIFNERADVEFRFHRVQENMGCSFSDMLRALPDLVFLMDESHNVRAEKSMRAINALKPVLGLEFTATPKFPNVIYSYPLRRAVADGIVKRPVVIARRDDDCLAGEQEDIKLADGIRRHERKKALLEEYCRNRGLPVVVPRVLISTQDIKHSEQVREKLESDNFFEGRYKGKVLLVHSGSAVAQIEQLLNLEKTDNSIEIVVHVNKLKEGWDVKTIYTIIPLRASVSDILTEQTIGRGLRLPFGRSASAAADADDASRDMLVEIDTLEIVSHDKYSALLDRARQALDTVVIRTESEQRAELVETREIAPDINSPYTISIPLMRARFYTKDDADFSNIVVSYSRFENVDVQLVGTDLATSDERVYESAICNQAGSLVSTLVAALIDETNEFDARDEARLCKAVQAYMDAANVIGGDKESVLFKHRGKILKDIKQQLLARVAAVTRVEYEWTGKYVEFRPYWRSVPVGYVERHKTNGSDASYDIVTGYTKTIFCRNAFESKQEKWFADILDRDEDVLRWVRLPINQMSVAYKGGHYNPDFIVETSSGMFVIEIKGRDRLDEADVRAKAQAGIQWCAAASRATGQSWYYKLIPHDAVDPTASFRGVLSHATT